MDNHKAHLASKHEAPNSDSSQDRDVTIDDNIPVMVELYDKDSQSRGRPIVYDITFEQETDADQQPITTAPLRRPNTWPKVLTCGRGRGKFPLANWTSVTKGCGQRHNSRCHISEGPPLVKNQEPIEERNSAVAIPTEYKHMK